MGIAIDPIQATDPVSNERFLLLAYFPENDSFLGMDANGRFVSVDRLRTTADWRYNSELGAWESPDEPVEEVPDDLVERHEMAVRALFAISEFTHTPGCPNQDDFTVWECNCTTLKPDAMARMTLDALQNLEHEDLRDEQTDEEVPVPPLPSADPD